MKILKSFLLVLLFLPALGQNNIAMAGSNEELKILGHSIPNGIENTSSFELHDRLIIVNAKLNGKNGKYILDTGAPTLILNQKIQKPNSSVGGIALRCDSEIVEVNLFEWAGISNKNFEAIALDMSELEKSIGLKIDGLIGQNIFSNYEVFLDVANRKIQLFNPRKSNLHNNSKYLQKINFSLDEHLPIISVKINGKKYKFAIDTGAEVNVLSIKFMKEFGDNLLKNVRESSIHGIKGISQKVQSATLSNFKIKKKNFRNFDFLFMDFSPFEKEFDLKIDGILGYPFLKENKISINYRKKKIYFW